MKSPRAQTNQLGQQVYNVISKVLSTRLKKAFSLMVSLKLIPNGFYSLYKDGLILISKRGCKGKAYS